jgi:uncharacterized protein (TIGR02145 family)
MNRFFGFAVSVVVVGLLFSCTSDLESAEEILRKGESSSSSLPGGLVSCYFASSGVCRELDAVACSMLEGQIVVFCPGGVSSSSSLAGGSSSSGVFNNSSSSVASSSSSLPSGMVWCVISGNCTVMESEFCSVLGGTSVQSCNDGGSSSNSSSSGVTPLGTSGEFKDSRDGQTYKWVKIGTQTWMAENLNYAPNSGTFISCDTYKCAIYGRLYDWSTAMTVCPSGWHLPSKAEWDVLGSNAKKLKATSGWGVDGSKGGTDDYGFSALPGGFGYYSYYESVGDDGYWWSNNEIDYYDAYSLYIAYDDDYTSWYYDDKSFLNSVRCLQD